MNAARLRVNEAIEETTRAPHWTAYATVYISAAADSAPHPSNDIEASELIRDRITHAAMAVDDRPPAHDDQESRCLLSINEAAMGLAGAFAAFVAIAALVAA